MTTGYEDLIPNNQDAEIENVFEDLIPSLTKTEIPGTFSMDRFTDKKKFIGSSSYEEDYEDITDDLGGFDKFFFQTLGGNEKVFREKKSGFDFEALRNAVLSREASEIVGALGGYEGVKI